MKIYNNVRGTMSKVPNIEVNKDTVYIRNNIKKIENDNFVGWEYDEVQYEIKEYTELTSVQLQELGKKLSEEKIDNMKKDSIINNLGKELSKLKLEILQIRGGNL